MWKGLGFTILTIKASSFNYQKKKCNKCMNVILKMLANSLFVLIMYFLRLFSSVVSCK